MTYLQSRNRPASQGRRLVLGLFGVLVILVALIEYRAPYIFPNIFMSIAKPYWRTKFSIVSGSLQSSDELLRENEDLKRQLADASVQLSDVNALQNENQELRSLLGRASTTPYTVAAVLARPPLSGYDELILDIGQNEGFAPGDTVYAAGNVPIGVISEALGETSKAMLYSSPGQKYPVLIGASHIAATAVGRGGGQYEAELPRDAKTSQGDFVLAPSLGDKPFGIVTSVVTDPTEPFETVLFAPPLNIYELRWVLVGKALHI